MTDTPQLAARVLPAAAAILLQQAAQADISADALARVKAIERATARVKRDWPMYFRQEDACTKPLP